MQACFDAVSHPAVRAVYINGVCRCVETSAVVIARAIRHCTILTPYEARPTEIQVHAHR
ncbi:hypothetical protein BV25DRAFT_1826016 [Artomyces pyxidatus]|uniref:Uncharacterized protein n=1 Tax=Artomyces pyxidatus TaxID=48021 RepID=A0ACB8T0Y6_9AGAM|nr:hypothetical protein BV25DRAFT_1826016 [Artomyces pyxidatus]